MAEPLEDIDKENNLAEEDEEENGETNASTILAGLNLVTIMSLLSLSEEERSNFDEIQEMETGNNERKAKHGVSKSSLQAKRQQVNQFPALARQTTRVQTKIRDSRHCRRF